MKKKTILVTFSTIDGVLVDDFIFDLKSLLKFSQKLMWDPNEHIWGVLFKIIISWFFL